MRQAYPPSTVPQDRHPELIAWMSPLLSDDDRENMTRIWQMVMPPEAFGHFLPMIEDAVRDGWSELSRRIPGLAA